MQRWFTGPRRTGASAGLLALVVTAVVVVTSASGHSAPDGPVRVAGTRPRVAAVDAAEFAPGACVSMAPTHGDNDHSVFLDAGHGGLDPGSIGQTQSGQAIEEADETLPVELDAAAILRARGFRVVVSRTRSGSGAVARLDAADISGNELTLAGVHADVAARAICANRSGAQALVGIYFDAGEPWNAGSVTGYDPDRSFSAANLRLATAIQRDTLAAMDARGWQIPSEGVQDDAGLGSAIGSAAEAYPHLLELGPAKAGYFSTPSRMPGAVIEPLFITDPFEGSIANSSIGQHVIASGIAQGVEQYFTPQTRRSVTSGARECRTQRRATPSGRRSKELCSPVSGAS